MCTILVSVTDILKRLELTYHHEMLIHVEPIPIVKSPTLQPMPL